MPFFISLHKTTPQFPHNKNQTIVVISPEDIRGNQSDAFNFILNMVIDHGCARVIVSMARIEYLDSMGIGSLINVVKAIRKTGGEIILSDVAEPVMDIFRKVRMDVFVKIAPNEEDALAILRRFISK